MQGPLRGRTVRRKFHVRDLPGNSRLEATLVDAYRATHYRVIGTAAPFLLRVDLPSRELAACHREHAVDCSAFLTAWNPHSQPVSAQENASAQGRLATVLHGHGCVLVAALGVDPAGLWQAEQSVLALGLDLEHALAVARDFRQNALLWAGADAVPRLILLR